VPLLIGIHAGRSLAESLSTGYRPAMIAIAVLCAAAAFVSWLFVSDDRGAAPANGRASA
jgi:hypothetical protein